MSEYIGTRCIVCSEKFTSEDDIVVCPECGTPYHRDCYNKEGKCVNDALHKSGGSWKPAYDTGSGNAEYTAVVCRHCGNVNPPLTLFCKRCGMPSENIRCESDKAAQIFNGVDINENPDAYNQNMNGNTAFNPYFINFSDPLCGFNPDEDVDGVKMADLGDFVGSNTHYYLPIFKRMKEIERVYSLNFCAMLFPELYFSYRKMPLIALAAWIGRIISQIPQVIVMLTQVEGMGALSEMAASIDVTSNAFRGVIMIGYAIFYSLMFILGFNANRFYFRSAVKKIKKVKAVSDGRDTRGEIVRKGGTSALLLVLFILLMVMPYGIFYFMQFVPALGML
ncbi:MAG: hypothetical protein J6K17_08025 [Oscillospiraceae bacterium]|nr:hypothetical protein [Oscillospiraceae bacterium]